MRFFSKLVTICNVCFIITVIMRYLQINNKTGDTSEALGTLPLLQSALVVLGYGAILLNFIFIVLLLFSWIFKKPIRLPKWLIIFNVAIFAWQVIFHFK